jgi:ribose transport system substrate-binding protein
VRRNRLTRRPVPSLLLVASVATILALTAAGCGDDDDGGGGGSGKTVKLGVFLASSANTYWTAALQGAEDAAKKQGNVDITTFDGEFKTGKQVNQLRDALISQRFDAWFIGPNDGGPLTPTIKQAISQDVKVGCTLVPCGPDIRSTKIQIPGQVAFAGVSFYKNGQSLGKLVAQGCKGIDPCKVAWLPGLPELPLEKARTDGLKSIIDKDPNIELVTTQAGGYLAAPALKATQNILQANPDINVIVSSGDQMIAGAYKAAKLAGYKDGEIKMYGNGCTIEAKKLILEGKQTGCTVYQPRTEAREVVDLLIRAARGEDIEGRVIDPIEFSPIGDIGTKENLGQFKPEFHS